MADLALPLQNGLNTVIDPKQLPAGYLTRATGVYYKPDDDSQLWKVEGRTLLASDVGGATGAAKAFCLLTHSTHSRLLVLKDDDRVYEIDPATGASYGAISDAQAVPVEYAIEGDYFVGLPDGSDRWFFYGATNKAPMIRDKDGNWRVAGMATPSETMAFVSENTVAPTVYRPTSDSGDFRPSSSAYAYDQDSNTHSTAELNTEFPGANAAHDFSYSAIGAGTTLGHKFYVDHRIRTDSVLNLQAEAIVNYYVSTDGGATFPGTPDWTDNFIGSNDQEWRQIIQFPVADATTVSQIVLRAELVAGTGVVLGEIHLFIHELYLSNAGNLAGYDFQTDDRLIYGFTEIYKRELSDGSFDEVESPMSNQIEVTPTVGASIYGLNFAFPAAIENGPDTGYALEFVKRRVYRTTVTGVYPNMGLVAELDSDIVEWEDDLSIEPTTLGSPGFFTVTGAGLTIPAASAPPPLKSATVHNGAIVGIPWGNQQSLVYNIPGFPDYWPQLLHRLDRVSTERNDSLVAVASVNDNLLVYLQNRVLRFKILPLAGDGSAYTLSGLADANLSANEGLVNPRARVAVQAQRGTIMDFFVASSGIYMTDGTLLSERGLGVRKVSSNIDWEATVDVSQLATSARLSYDPRLQIVWFDYMDNNNQRRSLTIHASGKHWVQTGQDALAPKITGPHIVGNLDRVTGFLSATPKMWTLDSGRNIWTEGGFVDNAKWFNPRGEILSLIESGWVYPAGPSEEFRAFEGTCYHSNWGRNASVDIDLLFRRDASGLTQRVLKRAISLNGERTTPFVALSSGQAVRFGLRQISTASGALGPLVLTIESQGETEQE